MKIPQIEPIGTNALPGRLLEFDTWEIDAPHTDKRGRRRKQKPVKSFGFAALVPSYAWLALPTNFHRTLKLSKSVCSR